MTTSSDKACPPRSSAGQPERRTRGVHGRTLLAAAAALTVAVGVAGCAGGSVSTGSFKGEQKAVATRVSDFEKDVSEGTQSKVCSNDLAVGLEDKIAASTGLAVTAGTERTPAVVKVCHEAIKEQLKDVESVTVSIASIVVSGRRATATIESTWSGKEALAKLYLVKEPSGWLISGL
jgi:hypothetical protein